jgi:hypothetical protein
MMNEESGVESAVGCPVVVASYPAVQLYHIRRKKAAKGFMLQHIDITALMES